MPKVGLTAGASQLVAGLYEHLTLETHPRLPDLCLLGNFYAYPKQLIFTVRSPCCNALWNFVWGEKAQKALQACINCGLTISEDPSVIFVNTAPSYALKPVWHLKTWGTYYELISEEFNGLEQVAFTATLEDKLLQLADWLFMPARANAGSNREATARAEAVEYFTFV